MTVYDRTVDDVSVTLSCADCHGTGKIQRRVPRCDVRIDGCRCVLADSPAHKYHSPALFTEDEERRVASQNQHLSNQDRKVALPPGVNGGSPDAVATDPEMGRDTTATDPTSGEQK